MKSMLLTAIASSATALLLARTITYMGLWQPDLPGIETIATPVFAFAITIGWLAAARGR